MGGVTRWEGSDVGRDFGREGTSDFVKALACCTTLLGFAGAKATALPSDFGSKHSLYHLIHGISLLDILLSSSLWYQCILLTSF